MNGHVGAGIVIIGLAAFLFIMGIKGTQHQLFPQVFGPPNTSSVDKNKPNAQGYKQGNCPDGWIEVPSALGAPPVCVPNILGH